MEISPSVLEFKGPFTQSSTEYITLTNTTNGVLAFKVKTTAPKLYCVRPNASVVAPGEKLEVSIILQGLREEPSPDYKCRDKFLLVSLPCPYNVDEETAISELWPQLEQEYKAQSVSKKIRVNYVLGGSPAQQSSNSDGAQLPPTYNDVPAAAAAAPVTPSANKILRGNDTFANETTVGDVYSTLSTPVASKTLNSNEVQKEINDSNAKIARLNEKLDSNVKSVSSPSYKSQSNNQYEQSQQKLQTLNQETISNGVSYPTALILALIAFLIGWLFF